MQAHTAIRPTLNKSPINKYLPAIAAFLPNELGTQELCNKLRDPGISMVFSSCFSVN
jgi:hypothetical protein